MMILTYESYILGDENVGDSYSDINRDLTWRNIWPFWTTIAIKVTAKLLITFLILKVTNDGNEHSNAN